MKDIFGAPIYREKRKMTDYFIVPPFSILNTMSEQWLIRKRKWLKITGDLTESKEGVLGKGMLATINKGSSNFDPVLAEIMYKWFNIKNGKVLDPFAGEQTKGVVCGELGYPYFGNEYRREQVEINTKVCQKYKDVHYFCGDSNFLDTIIKERDFDLCFTSPPYYDLEVYSKEDMSALGTYKEFMKQYENIFQKCYSMLKENRFLVIKVGEIRNKKTGEYRNFVGDNITIMKRIGFKYYNELIVQNSTGTLPLRVGGHMNASRKIGKQHQNILVFYKGDLKQIKTQFHELIPKNNYYDKNQ